MNVRRLFAVGVLAAALTAPANAAHLSHAIALVRDMNAGRRVFEAAGFNIEPTRPLYGGMIHAVIPFADGTFLELIAAVKRTSDSSDVLNFLKYGDGFAAAGFEVSDVTAERAKLIARGFRMDPVSVSPHWYDLDFSEPAGILDPFFYFTYRNVDTNYYRRMDAKYDRHPNGAVGLRGLDVAVEPGIHAAATYAAAGLNGLTPIESGAGDARIVVVRLATSNPQRKGTTIAIGRTRIRFE